MSIQKSHPSFPRLEKDILVFWKENKIFEKSLSKSSEKRFVFFEGPPFANGKPGVHHILARTFKDVIARYKTMQGYFVGRKAGWDTHGLPPEMEAEKQLGIRSKRDIETLGIEKFIETCRSSVFLYKEEWERMTERMGYWLDLKNPYLTLSREYIESVWWILKEVWKKGLMKKDYKVLPYCPRCGTSLSSHELALGYEENVEDPSIYVKFKVKGKDEFFLVWTTTPWTLPGNVALAVGKDIDYVKVKLQGAILILAKARLELFREEVEVIGSFRGEDLSGIEYEPLYSFVTLKEKAHYVVLADFVSVEEGTGIVHTAVMYGAEDFELGKTLGLPNVHLVDLEGKFIPEAKPFAGSFVKDADPKIIEDLRGRNLLFRSETIRHTYPLCWRCDTPILYYAKYSWFIRMTAVKEELLDNSEAIRWIPPHIKKGRFGEWLREVKDWAISRERYWGTPLPIWECVHSECRFQECLGSIKELKEKARSVERVDELQDFHRPAIDKILLNCPQCGSEMRRIPEVLDCWFDSGAMPYAQWHYPFEHRDMIDDGVAFPADYIAEAIDQTRGWFYTLLAISTLLGLGTSFRNVVCLGLLLDKEGKKMSKSRGNVVDPWMMMDRYGADALRWYLVTMNQPGDAKYFDEKNVDGVLKKQFLILWNVLIFDAMIVNRFDDPESPKSSHLLDRWILASLYRLIRKATNHLDEYEMTEAARRIGDFIGDLSTWYVRRSRDRLKQKGSDGVSARATLFGTLRTLAKLLAPFTPFFAEILYRELRDLHPNIPERWKESVHLEDWPQGKKQNEDDRVVEEMTVVRKLAELAHAARASKNLKVRQPLSQLVVTPRLEEVFLKLLEEEVNVKKVIQAETLPRGSDWIFREDGKVGIALDQTMTEELKEEGMMREFVRQVNDLRKKSGLTMNDRIEILVDHSDPSLKDFFSFFENEIIKETLADALKSYEFSKELLQEIDLELDGKSVRVGIGRS